RRPKGGNEGQRNAAAPDFIGVLSNPRPLETTASRYRLSVICQSNPATADYERLSSLRARELFKNCRHQRFQIRQPIGCRDQHDDGDGEGREVLLVLQLSINRQEDVELALGQAEQFTVSFASPTHLRCRSRGVADELAFKPSGEALVKQDAH